MIHISVFAKDSTKSFQRPEILNFRSHQEKQKVQRNKILRDIKPHGNWSTDLGVDLNVAMQ